MATKVKARKAASGKIRYIGLYSTPDGRFLSAGTFGDRKVAEKAAIYAEKKAQAGTWVDPRRGAMTVDQFAQSTWMQTLGGLAATTQESYLGYYRRSIKPTFGEKALSSIRASDIQRWMTCLESDGHGASSVGKCKIILGLIFKLAVQDRLIESNPCLGSRNPTVTQPEVKILTPEQFDAFYAQVKGEMARALVLTAIGTGMRWSELAGLTPSQVDFLRRTVLVDRSVVGLNDGVLRKPYPKGRKPRTIPVDDEVLAALAEEIKRRRLEPRSVQEIFTTPSGTFLRHQNFMPSSIMRAFQEAGLEEYGFSFKHLRSSYCSWLLVGGADLAIVQKLMGHTNIQTTQKYIQTLPDAMERARDVLTNVRTRSQALSPVTTLRTAR